MAPSEKLLEKLGHFLRKYKNYRQEVMWRGNIIIFSLMSTVMSVLLVFYSNKFFNNLILLNIIFVIM